jgi:hypothetical protein
MNFNFLLLLVTIIVFPFSGVQAQEGQLVGSRSQSLAGITAPLFDGFSIFGNQAGLSSVHELQIGVVIRNRFLVNELSSNAFFVVLPVQSSAFGFSFYQFGKNLFRQQQLGLTYAKKLGINFSAGVKFEYNRLFFSEENRWAGAAGVESGFQWRFSNQFDFGFQLVNLYRTGIRLNLQQFYLPGFAKLGTCYRATDGCSLLAELVKGWGKPLQVKGGIEFNLLNRVHLRTGVSGKPFEFSAGFGFTVENLVIDLATSYHQFLGHSPSVSVYYQFSK